MFTPHSGTAGAEISSFVDLGLRWWQALFVTENGFNVSLAVLVYHYTDVTSCEQMLM
jgi:hypothetical protein